MTPKKYLKIAVYFIAAVMLFGACNGKEKDPDTLSVSPSTLQFTFDGKQKDQKVTVTTNVANWDASKGANDGWIKISKGDGSFTVNVEEWKGNENRTGTITVTAGDAEAKTITVTQVKPGFNTLDINPTSVKFSPDEDVKQVTVSTSADSWDFVDPENGWLVLQKENNVLKISLSSINLSDKNLTAEVVIKAERATDVTLTVTVETVFKESVTIEGKSFKKGEVQLSKNSTITLAGDLANDNVVVNLDFFERINTSSVKFLGETGKHTLYYSETYKIVLIQLAAPDYPDYLIALGKNFSYPSKIGKLWVTNYPENSKNTDILKYVPFRKTGDKTYQGTVMLKFRGVEFKMFHAKGGGNLTQGWGTNGEYKYDGCTFSGVPNIFSDGDGYQNWLVGEGVEETHVYRITVTITKLATADDPGNADVKIEKFAEYPVATIQEPTEELEKILTGKVWKMGEWSAMRNPDNRDERWWWFYDDEGGVVQDSRFTFTSRGKFTHVNNGKTFVNEDLRDIYPDEAKKNEKDEWVSFITKNYTPPTNATWDVWKDGDNLMLSIRNGFLGYAVNKDYLKDVQYRIFSYSGTSIRLGDRWWAGWCFELVPAN